MTVATGIVSLHRFIWKAVFCWWRCPVSWDQLGGCSRVMSSHQQDFPGLETPADMGISSLHQAYRQCFKCWDPVKFLTRSQCWISAAEKVVAEACTYCSIINFSCRTRFVREWIEFLRWKRTSSVSSSGNDDKTTSKFLILTYEYMMIYFLQEAWKKVRVFQTFSLGWESS